jgi:hypothetical protein
MRRQTRRIRPLHATSGSDSRLDCALPPPQLAVDADGTLSPAWWACMGAVHGRTGGGEGISTAAVADDLATETAQRQAADVAIHTDIAAEAVTRANADTTETNARLAADTTLQTNITAEATARASADLLLVPLDGSRAMTGQLRLPAQQFTTLPINAANDAAAAAAGVPVGGVYRTGSILSVRVT